jgi:hypothetical protein
MLAKRVIARNEGWMQGPGKTEAGGGGSRGIAWTSQQPVKPGHPLVNTGTAMPFDKRQLNC